MPPYQWTSIETGCRDKGTEEEAIKPTKDTKGVSPHSENQEAHNLIDPPIETLHQEGHASSVDKWVTTLETVQGRRNKNESISSTMMITSRFKSNLPLSHKLISLRSIIS